ncbi:MAG: response regulator transcription factor [Myxococcota bacterium]|jgi:DNA-binding NarL/FixJ family response regulator
MIKVLIVDDHAIVRRGLRQILLDESSEFSVAEAADGDQAIEAVRQHPFDVAVLDISMPGRTGLDVLKEIRDLRPKLPVLMLSIHPESQYAVRALRAGAYGYLTKDSAPAELVNAVRKVASGGRYITQAVGEKLALTLDRDPGAPPHETLSNREHYVLCMIGSGRTITEIARELKLSVKTVSTYRSRMLAKMGMRTSAELTRYAIENGLVK